MCAPFGRFVFRSGAVEGRRYGKLQGSASKGKEGAEEGAEEGTEEGAEEPRHGLSLSHVLRLLAEDGLELPILLGSPTAGWMLDCCFAP